MNTQLKKGDHAERMQKMIDGAFEAENRLNDDDLITIKVGNLAEFVRHYLAIKTTLQSAVDDTRERMSNAEEVMSFTEKLLKGEL